MQLYIQLLRPTRKVELPEINVAVQSGRNYRILRKSGVTVRKTIDVIIGTFCIIEGLPLLHDDRDFEPMVTHFSLRTPSPG